MNTNYLGFYNGHLQASAGPLRASTDLTRATSSLCGPQQTSTALNWPHGPSTGLSCASAGHYGPIRIHRPLMGLSWANAGLNWPLMDLYGPQQASHGPCMGYFGPHGPSTGIFGPLRATWACHGPQRASMRIYWPLMGLYGPLWASNGPHIGLS